MFDQMVHVVGLCVAPARSLGKRLLQVLVAAVVTVALGTAVSCSGKQAQQSGSLTVEQIGDALTSYGKNTITNNGQTVYTVTLHRGKSSVNVIINLSPNGRVIWMTDDVVDMPDPSKTSRVALLNILKKNRDIGPMFFSINGSSLRLSYPVPNFDLTPKDVKEFVDALASTVVDTAVLWNRGTLSGR